LEYKTRGKVLNVEWYKFEAAAKFNAVKGENMRKCKLFSFINKPLPYFFSAPPRIAGPAHSFLRLPHFLLCIFAVLILFQAPLPSSAEVQPTFYISAEDILNAQAKAPDVNFSRKENREIRIMEKRHFASVNTFDSDKYRIAKLEEHLLGRTWEFLPVEDRMRKLKLASQRKMLSGTAIPTSLRRAGFSPKRIANDSTPVYDNDDNVGLIDGFLKLISPDAYHGWANHRKRMYEQYDYE